MSYEIDKVQKDKLDNAAREASKKLNEFLNKHPKGAFGLTTDETKNSVEYKKLKSDYDKAESLFKHFMTSTKFATKYNKEIKDDIQKNRNNRLANKSLSGVEISAAKPKPNAARIESLKKQIEDIRTKIRSFNDRLDHDVSKEEKDRIHDQLDDLKDKRKYLSNQVTDLETASGGNKMKLVKTFDRVKVTTVSALKNMFKETSSWFDELSEKEQKEYLKQHPTSKLLSKNKLQKHKDSARDLSDKALRHVNQKTFKSPEAKEVNEKLKKHHEAINDHQKEEQDKQADYNVKTGRLTPEEQDKILKSWGKTTDKTDSGISKKAQLKILKNRIKEFQAKQKELSDNNEIMKIQMRINGITKQIRELKAEETSSFEVLSGWFDDLSEKEQKEYLKNHPNSKLLTKKKLAKHQDTYDKLGDERVKHLNKGDYSAVRRSNKKVEPHFEAIREHKREQEDTQPKETSSFKEIASDWFESLSVKKQKAYIDSHPDSKFAHKIGTGKEDKSVTKNKGKMIDHLEQEGVDLDKDHSQRGFSDNGKVNTVAEITGKKGAAKGSSKARALSDDLSNHKRKMKDLQDKIDKIQKELDMDEDTAKGDLLADKRDELKKQLQALQDK